MAKKPRQEQAEVFPRIISPADVAIAYKQVFSTQVGQIVLADLMRLFGFNRHSIYQKGGGTEQMLLNEGGRKVLVHIGIQIDLDPAALEDTQRTEV